MESSFEEIDFIIELLQTENDIEAISIIAEMLVDVITKITGGNKNG